MGGMGKSSGKTAGIDAGTVVQVADWFTFDLPNYAIQPKRVTIVGESKSGKAYKVDIDTETIDGERALYYTKFIPKAAVKTQEQVEYEYIQATERFNRGKKRYENMLKYAKEKGVKGVRKGMRKETILKKMEEAGINYNYYQ